MTDLEKAIEFWLEDDHRLRGDLAHSAVIDSKTFPGYVIIATTDDNDGAPRLHIYTNEEIIDEYNDRETDDIYE
jgi:hypothetical protein